jgi:hypothetical protein
MEKQQQVAKLLKEIEELKALLQPKDTKDAAATKDEPEEKTAKVSKKAAKDPEKAAPVEKPAEEPKKAPALKLVPR